jgi:hypothetical protein
VATCPTCGSALPEDSRFCNKCGHEIAASENNEQDTRVLSILDSNDNESPQTRSESEEEPATELPLAVPGKPPERADTIQVVSPEKKLVGTLQ